MTDETPAPDQNTDFSDINANLASGLSSFGADDQTNAGEPDLDQETIDPIDVAESAMNASRERLGTVPAEVVITNHLMGLYELAAIHLSANPPDLVQSALAIDALACLVDGLGDRIGPDTPTMRDALNNIRLAFVQIKGAANAD
ncbi:hypothetical protein [uncultured Ilumatobacter sp.]|uniref:hypothetical protein n=1 Tax=uncultured Ilumatobacter sp. TaxID=879968 RepID=UPI00374F6A03